MIALALTQALDDIIQLDPGLRSLTESDVDDIVEIERLGYSHPWSEGVFRDSLRSGYVILGIEREGRLDGYGVLAVLYDEAHLLNLCVRPASRGRGQARKLLKVLLEGAVGQGLQRMVLEVRVSNHAARRLYLSEGFEVVGERPGYYPDGSARENALVMAIGLAGPANPVA